MKAKLTITVDEELVPRAKRYARSRGMSLSALIERALRDMTGPGDAPTFSARWRGSMEMAGRDDARYRELAKKYG